MNFEIITEEKHTIVKSKLEKLDTLHAPDLKSEFVMINKQGVKNIIMDLSETRYCDSSGLSALLVANRLCKGEEGSFVICGLQDPVQKLINISQLHNVLNITPTVNEAVDFLYMEEVERGLGEE